jgi:ADP-ribose pyrophosphatase YjhB (NUDIX family)
MLWVWKHLPLSGRAKALVAVLANVRYAVGVAAVVRNNAGEVLLLRHTYRRAGHEWGLPGGWVKGRESMERALTREIQEETGFTIAIDRLVAIHSGYSLPRMTVIYLAHIEQGEFRSSDEVSAYRFSASVDLGAILPGERMAVRQALDTTAS